MISTRIRTRIAAATIAAMGVVGVAAATGTGDAAADGAYPLNNCIGLSPNIVDAPYWPTRAIVAQYAGKTYITTEFSSYWFGVGYESTARLDWRNLQTGQRGSMTNRSAVKPPYTGTHVFTIPTNRIGKGRVQVTLSTVNRNAVWALPTPTCGGVITVS